MGVIGGGGGFVGGWMDLGCLWLGVGLSMRGIGRMICLMVKVYKAIQMVQHIKANSSTAKKTTKTVPTNGQTTKSTQANSTMATCKVMVNYSCQIQKITANMKVNFHKIK